MCHLGYSKWELLEGLSKAYVEQEALARDLQDVTPSPSFAVLPTILPFLSPHCSSVLIGSLAYLIEWYVVTTG